MKLSLLSCFLFFLLFGCSSTKLAPKRHSLKAVIETTKKTSSSNLYLQTPVQAQTTTISNSLEREQQQGNWLKVLFIYDATLMDFTSESFHEKHKAHGLEIIDSRLSSDELESFAEKAKTTSFKSATWCRLGELNLEKRNYSSARKYFEYCQAIIEEPIRSEKAKQFLEKLDGLKTIAHDTIGVVLPLTGKNAAISQKILRGIQLGLGFDEKKNNSFRLALADSGANPDLARQGVENLIKEDSVIAIVGGVLGKTAVTEASASSGLGVPFVALTQKSGVTDIGPNVFRNAITSEMQVRFLVRKAIEDLGIKKFAVLFPNDSYGVEYTNIFWDEVLARGGQIRGAQSYSPKETDFRHIIQKLIGTYYIEARHEEYKLKEAEQIGSQRKKSDRDEQKDSLLPPVVDFEAIFIPDGTKALGQISAMLAYNGVKGIKLLGTNLWNLPDLGKRAGPFSDSLLFVDSFLNSEEIIENSNFVKNFKSIYSQDPGLFELQGYDSALIIQQLITQGATNRETLNQALINLKNFPGAFGPLSMTEEREIIRPLTCLKLSNGTIVPF